MQMMDHRGQNDQKNYAQEGQILLDQDREQTDANESLQLRGDEPVSELYIWGNDYYGQLGVGSDKVIHNLPKICSFNIVVSDVSCGEEHTVFVQGDGGYVYAMGSNSEGRLGTGNPEMRSCNVPTLVDGLCNIKKVSCGTSHTLALSDDGQVYAWGQAFYGALGIKPNEQGALENVFAPKIISQEAFDGKNVKDLEAGSRHSIFVTNNNLIYGCGDANQGQLGLGDANRDRVTEPTQVMTDLSGMSIYQVSCGKYHTLLLTNNPKEGNRRELWACGANNFGQIGNNSNQNQFKPVRVDPRLPEDKIYQNCRSHKFKQISTWHASAAVTEEGIMYVWGAGIFGEFKRPRKVKLQNNIRVQSVNVGGSFIVIVDQDNKIVVWGSNSNGEIGVGDSKVRNHPTRLETIEDKLISKVGVGGSFAFAIGKTTSRMENSIFDDAANERSHISGIGRNGTSNIMEDMKEPDNERNNRSIHSLEEQLQQIALHSGSKKQDSEDRQQRPQDRSVGNFSNNNNAGGHSRFEQAANRVSLQHSGKALSDSAPAAQAQDKSLQDQVSYLKQIIEEKERTIKNLNDQSQQKHEEYQEKLLRFKEMQDQELNMSNKLREENTKLRSENDQIRDENIELKQQVHELKKNERPQYERSALAPGKQESGSSQTQKLPEQMASKPNYFPGVNSTLPSSSTTAPIQSMYQRSLTDQVTSSTYQKPQQSSNAYPKYEPYQQRDGSDNNLRGSLDTTHGLSSMPDRLGLDDLNQRETLNDDRFQQTYLRGGEAQPPTSQTAAFAFGARGSNTAEDSHVPSTGNYSREDGYNRDSAGGKLESAYNQRYHQAGSRPIGQQPPSTSGYLEQHNNQHEHRVSVDIDNLDRSPGSTIKKRHDFNRQYNNDEKTDGGLMRSSDADKPHTSHLLMSRGIKDEYNYKVESNHERRASQVTSDLGAGGGDDNTFRGRDENTFRGGQVTSSYQQPPHMSSNFANRMDEQSSQSRLNNQASAYSRDRVSTGRVENLRSMGADLMRPPSGYPESGNNESAQSKMRNSSSGFYQPSNKYARLGEYDGTDEDYQHPSNNIMRRDTDEGERGNNPANLPDPAEIQNRLRNANRFSQERSSPDINSTKRSVTPNAVSQSYEPLGQNRVAYKPTYERLTSQQTDFKENASQGGSYGGYKADSRYNDQHLPGKTDFANASSSMPTSSQKDQSNQFKQRPGSGNGRDPLYQTQNNLQSMKYENLIGSYDAFTSKYGQDTNNNQGSSAHKEKSSPTKPPRNDIYRPKMNHDGASQQQEDQFTSSYAAQQAPSNHRQYAFTPTADRTSNSDMTSAAQNHSANDGAGRPPTYKNGDYQTRYSYDPPLQSKDQTPSGNGMTNNYRMPLDPAEKLPAGTSSVMGVGLTMSKPASYSQHASNSVGSGGIANFHQRYSGSAENGSEHQHQRNSEIDMTGKLPQMNGSRLPERTSSFSGGYGDRGHNEVASSLANTRSPFSAQQLNEQQPAYGRLGGPQSFTPQGSGRRSGSLMEQHSQNNNEGGEDIRTKLARYKKEREDFEVIRQNFRKKNSELGVSSASGGNAQSENTPMANSYKLGGAGGSDNTKGQSNIFATDNSATQVQTFQAHVVTGGSPAFGQPEPYQSRDH